MLFLGMATLVGQALAQEITVAGKVTAVEDGLGLPGVSVKVKGSPTVTQTNAAGQYTIK